MSAGDMALLLLLSGTLLIYAEFNRPGTILLGAAGALLLMLGVARLLPLHLSAISAAVSIAGMGLVVSGLRHPWRSRHGAGALAGMVALIAGLHGLVKASGGVHWTVAVAAGTALAGVTYLLGRIAVLAARNKRLPVPVNLGPYGGIDGKVQRSE